MSPRFVTYPTWQDVYDVRPTWESLIEEIRAPGPVPQPLAISSH